MEFLWCFWCVVFSKSLKKKFRNEIGKTVAKRWPRFKSYFIHIVTYIGTYMNDLKNLVLSKYYSIYILNESLKFIYKYNLKVKKK